MVLAAGFLCLTAVGSLAQTDDNVFGNQDLRSARGRRQHAGRQAAGRHEGVDGPRRLSLHRQRTAVVRARVEAGHERHRHHHDANDSHTGHRHRGEERHGRAASGASIIVRTDEGVKMFTQGDVDKRGVKIMRDGKPVQLVGLP